MRTERRLSGKWRQRVAGWIAIALVINGLIWWISATATSPSVIAASAVSVANVQSAKAGWNTAVAHAPELKGIGDGYPFVAPPLCQKWDPLVGVAATVFYNACVDAGVKIELGLAVSLH